MVKYPNRNVEKDKSADTHVTRVCEDDSQSTLQVTKARLKVVSGPDKGRQKDLSHFRLVVGSAPECDLVLTDPAVSRRHFELAPGQSGYRVRDLGSTNGTEIKGLKIKEAELGKDEVIKIGQTKLRFSMLDEQDEFLLSPRTSFGALLGHSVAMRQVFAVLERTAQAEATVLLEGESGTGKDLAAETIHQHSNRNKGPFVVVDCGTIQSSLIESELFGHRRGAFTGAEQDRQGAMEAADGGTIFLDEIGELTPAVQPKLLRLLEKKEIKRLGENSYRQVDVRLLAATNRDIMAEVEAGRFREDLFYRLSVVRVRMPVLRDRLDDMSVLAQSFVSKLRPDLDPKEIISQDVLNMLCSHDWPGNVRELRNVVERLLLFPDRPQIVMYGDAKASSRGSLARDLLDLPFHEARRRVNDKFEKEYVEAVLQSCKHIISRAAKKAGIARQTFYRLLEKYKIPND